MPGKVIGKILDHGFAGDYARQPDIIVVTRPNVDATNIVFGKPVVKGVKNGVTGVKNVDASFTAADFLGVASSEVKTVFNYLDQNSGGGYSPDEPVSVFQRGSINVICGVGTPAPNGDVYIRTVASTGKEVGDFEATDDPGNNVKLENAQWGGSIDANKIAELVILTRINA